MRLFCVPNLRRCKKYWSGSWAALAWLPGAGLKGGYFVSLDTTKPVADRVVALAKEAGVALTPAGATYPHGRDPHNSNIRLSPSRPPVEEVKLAMEVVALCVKLASA
jgi:DNA-binding transcriptional MocR family regulator